MATIEGISIDDDTDEVTVRELTIQDEEIADYLSDFDPIRREDALERALRIGTSALQLVDTSKEVEYVDRRFEEMEREFESEIEGLRDELERRFSNDDGELIQILDRHLGEGGHLKEHLENAFGDDGQLAERLEAELGEDGDKIQKALDPDREGTPTYRLKRNILDEIETVKQQLEREEGRQEVRDETRLKGFDFEDQVERILQNIVYQTPNRVTDTSKDIGSLNDSKKGDFVVTLDETDQRIVVEAKNGHFNSTVGDEMDEAIENRNADYGVLIASSLEYLPRTKVGWFSEIDQDYVVVALSEEPDDEVEPRFLKFAYHWARTRTLLSSVEVGTEVDTEMVKSELKGVQEEIEKFSQVRTKCGNIEDSVSAIRSQLNDIEDEVTSRTSRLEAELIASVD